MEDILASIRRILAEDEPAPEAGAAGVAPAAVNGSGQPGVKEDVLVLDSSMLAPAQPANSAVLITPPPPVPAPAAVANGAAAVETKVATPAVTARAEVDDRPLVRRNNLPCFEDAVREALQPVIKQWLDAALPKLVERMVRTEVERVVGGISS